MTTYDLQRLRDLERRFSSGSPCSVRDLEELASLACLRVRELLAERQAAERAKIYPGI